MADGVRLTLEEVNGLAVAVLLAHGASQENAKSIADTVTSAERDECKSHGLFRIPFYVRGFEAGKVRGDAVPELVDVAPGIARVDAHGGYAPLALDLGIDVLAQKAREKGIAALGIVNCHHVAALWPEVERLAEQGLVAFAFTSYMAFVSPAGGTQPVYGTNPMAFGWPRVGKPPLVFDQASSVTARGEILLHKRDDQPIPLGWAIDSDGNPTTDPTAALGGAQLPFGGYKGAAIALMVELLAGPLIGSVFSFEASELDSDETLPPIGGEFVMAIDPARWTPSGDSGAQLAHAEKLFAKVLEQGGTRLPSDRRYAARQRTSTEGVLIPEALHTQIAQMAESDPDR